MSGKALDAGRSTSMEREPNCSRVLEEDGAHALALVRRAHGEIAALSKSLSARHAH